MQIKIKKLSEKAVLPTRMRTDDVGYDLTATSKTIVDNKDHGYIEYGTSLVMEIPIGYGGFIFPRGSISKTGLIQANAVGVVDPNYRGEVTVRYKAIPDTKQYEVNDRVAQIVIMPYESPEWVEVNELSETERGEGAYGSSDLKENK